MKISDFKRLEEKILNQNFHQGYKNINTVMFFLSIFGHLASIFLANFMLSKVFSGAMPDNPIFVLASSIILLTGLELLKRDIFHKFSAQYLKVKRFGKDVVPLFLLSLFIVSLSFYATIHGAMEFSSKREVIEQTKKEAITTYQDSLNVVYNQKISSIEDEIEINKEKIDIKDKEQTEIEALQPLTRQQRARVKDLKEEKTLLRNEIIKLEGDIESAKTELSEKAKQKETEIISETDNQKNDNTKNSLIFVIISTIIELVILAGVYFNQYYRFRSYHEIRNKLEKDPNYQKWVLYDKILSVIYTEDTRINEKLQASKSIIEMCKVNNIIILPKDMTDFLKTINGLNIIKISGSVKYINKQRDLAFEILKNHFKVE
jgi:hypothetical protein